jgi:HAE1 family hydrophobic/amphiphilic exporter-1
MNRRVACAAALCFLLASDLRPADLTGYIRRRFGGQDVQVRDIEGLRARIRDGKLPLHLRDFIELMLKNSPDVQIARLDVYTAANRITTAETPFDPVIQGSFTTERSVTPFFFGGGFTNGTTSGGGSNSSGAGGFVVLPQTISSLSQNTTLSYQQLLPTGQTFETTFNGIRSSGDQYPSPAVFGALNFTLTQPLLQNRTNLAARAPLIAARTELLISSERDEANIADFVANGAQAYWQAVETREVIRVQQQTFDLAQKSYEHDKLALDLGALAALDIYQSQTQVAERKRDLVQAQYQYRTALDSLRHLIGADVTPELRAVEVVLEDDPAQIPAKSEILPFEQALEKAMHARPEVKADAQQLQVDNLNARAARDALQPQLNLQINGGSSGPLISPTATTYPGLSDTLRQVFAFDFPSYGLGLQLNFPIRNSTAKANLSNALVSRAQDRYKQRQTNQQVILSVRQAIDNIELADASLDAATTARDLARKNVDAEQQKYQLGSITAFELLDSQNRLANTESALVAAYVIYQQAYVAYQRATWTLLDGFGVIVDRHTP